MFKMPGNMTICMDCMEKTMETVNQMDYQHIFNNPSFMNGFGPFGNPFGQAQKENVKKEEHDGEESTKVFDETSVTDVEETEEEAETKTKTPKRPFPNISFINLADLQMDGGIPNKQKLKKRKKQDKPILDIKNIPPPHKIKAQLDEYVIGQEKAKKVISVAVYKRVRGRCGQVPGHHRG